ncbi:MAG: hypothetical protein L6407_09440 [Candidatus Delongbacteria bacterium]|nr:hypothetical protein [Candidatus Delongbacteria bacterium]
MIGRKTIFRNMSKRKSIIYYIVFLNCANSGAMYGEAIMMKNEPIFIKDELLKTRKGLRK